MLPVDHNPKSPRPPSSEEPDRPRPPASAELQAASGGIAPQRIAELIDRIRESADKLAKDKTSRGDLKILSRTLRELRYAFKVFAPYRHRRKVTVFGSARDPARPAGLSAGRRVRPSKWPRSSGWWSPAPPAGSWRPATSAPAASTSMGLNILLPFEQAANRIIAGDPKLVHMKYFFTRKLMFVKESDAICLLPGGFGTLDEGLEVLTLLQTGKRDMVPVVFLDEPGGDYWKGFEQFVHRGLLDGGMISPEDLSLYRLTDRVDEAVAEILGFFRVYHSMRYVHNKLVLRLQQAPDEKLLAADQRAFRRHSARRAVRRRQRRCRKRRTSRPWPSYRA